MTKPIPARLILLHRPVPSTPADADPDLAQRRLQRVHMFPGRALGEEEFDQGQRYADLRLASLLRSRPAGIVTGLEVSAADRQPLPADIGISPGLALDGQGRVVTLYQPLRADWQSLIADWQTRNALDDATGIFYLLLERQTWTVNAAVAEPDQRFDLNPGRDSRLEVTARLTLQRLNLSPASLALPPEQVANRIVADRVDGAFLSHLGSAVPLALLAIEATPIAERQPDDTGFRPRWLAPEAGRYDAVPHSGYRTLLNQVSAALRRVTQAAAAHRHDDSFDPEIFLRTHLVLDCLPAAGQLPLDWLQDPASVNPGLLWLSSRRARLGIDMVPVPEEAIPELLTRHLPRRVVDLQRSAGDHLRLLLAVNEPDYRHDLLDIPQTDATLEDDLYRYHQRAHNAWNQWKQQFDHLYYIEPSNEAPLADVALAAVEKAVLDPTQFRKVLGLPKPEPQPALPATVVNAIIARADAELDPVNSGLPYPFSKGVPTPPAFYLSWQVNGQPPTLPPPQDDGLVVQYAVALVDLEAVENQIRAQRTRVEKTRDLLMVMRQQLDSQTVALAALAGGVAGDGSGLQVARWLPYANLGKTALQADTADTAEPPVRSAAVSRASKTAPTMTATAAKTAITSGVSGSLLNTALTANAGTAKLNLQLASKPASFSAFELGINKTRLDQLASLSKTAVSTPAFDAKEYRFGVLEHISPEVNEYAKAYYGMRELLATLKALFDTTDAARLRSQLVKVGQTRDPIPLTTTARKNLLAGLQELLKATDVSLQREHLLNVGKIIETGSLDGAQNPFQRGGQLEAPEVLDSQATKAAREAALAARTAAQTSTPTLPVSELNRIEEETFARLRPLYLSQYRYNALFKAGKILTQWIAIAEARYNNLERKLQGKLREQSVLLAHIDKLAALIREARETLEIRDRFRIEQLGDYGVAQRLLDEDWRRTFARNQERTRILTTGLRGLYYVRERGTPVSAALADPLELRHGSSGDIVPGCDWDQPVDLPDALDPFFIAVCEIPLYDWTALEPLRLQLPALDQFSFLNQMRQARFKARPGAPTTGTSSTLQARLHTVHQQTQTLMQQWAGSLLPVTGVASVQNLLAAAQVLSLEDLATLRGDLRNQAQALRDQLERCAVYLLERVGQMPGSIRLQWGQLAEDDRLAVHDVSRWPGLERAEADDFNNTRTLAELVAWLFRQQTSDASATSQAALRNLVRAVLIHASLGDPQEILRGTVQVPPRFVRPGERLQVRLNRTAPVGTRLQLLDSQQQLVALVAVEDHSQEGTEVSIVDLLHPQATINTRCSLVANKRTRQTL